MHFSVQVLQLFRPRSFNLSLTSRKTTKDVFSDADRQISILERSEIKTKGREIRFRTRALTDGLTQTPGNQRFGLYLVFLQVQPRDGTKIRPKLPKQANLHDFEALISPFWYG
ncbi:hypothetical protein HED22_05805 [Thalassospira sp. HF15]|uniref:hypothetical protein n=1 Tax=Thalassospira sp. HF15 TaxID=2722755 RepID=UPI00142F860F|nr:hypothetical protein [Thalassospira sp. HF15]NIY75153.1 hypothetical protein [Thalassospira sp. HF15]